MHSNNVVDSINRETMRAVVDEYSTRTDTTASETAALAGIADQVRNKRILDLGVGAGRTTTALTALSRDYIGIDYVPEMIAQCRARFSGVRFEHADARSMPQFADGSFDLIVFACNGISMVDHEGRLAILKEVRRLLSAGGVFVFSTYNQASAEHDQGFVLPDFGPTTSPVKIAKSAVRFVLDLGESMVNRVRHRRHEIRNNEYSIINDRSHRYNTMLYYITLEKQRAQLAAAGFRGPVRVYDHAGHEVSGSTRDDSMTFVVWP